MGLKRSVPPFDPAWSAHGDLFEPGNFEKIVRGASIRLQAKKARRGAARSGAIAAKPR